MASAPSMKFKLKADSGVDASRFRQEAMSGITLPKIDPKRAEYKQTIGNGSCGKVDQICHNEKGDMASKILANYGDNAVIYQRFAKEIKLLSAIQHKHIVDVIGFWDSPMTIYCEYMVFDWSEYSDDSISSPKTHDLRRFLDMLDKLEGAVVEFQKEFKYVCRIAYEVSSALAFLHSKDVAHRDLKPQNILVANNRWKPFISKLTDFGESRSFSNNLVNTNVHTLQRGTLPYMGPELQPALRNIPGHAAVTSDNPDDMKRADIWALGMVIFLLQNPDLKQPYAMSQRLMAKFAPHTSLTDVIVNVLGKGKLPLKSEKYPDLAKMCQENISNTQGWCAQIDPKVRPTAGTVEKWLQDTYDQQMLRPTIVEKPVKRKEDIRHSSTGIRKMSTDKPVIAVKPLTRNTRAFPALASKFAKSSEVSPGFRPPALPPRGSAAAAATCGSFITPKARQSMEFIKDGAYESPKAEAALPESCPSDDYSQLDDDQYDFLGQVKSFEVIGFPEGRPIYEHDVRGILTDQMHGGVEFVRIEQTASAGYKAYVSLAEEKTLGDIMSMTKAGSIRMQDYDVHVIPMEDDFLQDTCAVQIRNIQPSTTEQQLEMMFSYPGVGGPIEEVYINHSSATATITFEDAEIAKEIVQGGQINHAIRGSEASVLAGGRPCPKLLGRILGNQVLLRGIPENHDTAKLRYTLQSVSGRSVKSMQYHLNRENVIVTFQANPALYAVKNHFRFKPFQGKMLSFEKLKVPSAIKLFSVGPSTEDDIRNAFRSYDQSIASVRFEANDNKSALITFWDRKVVQEVMNQENLYELMGFKIEFHFDMLGSEIKEKFEVPSPAHYKRLTHLKLIEFEETHSPLEIKMLEICLAKTQIQERFTDATLKSDRKGVVIVCCQDDRPEISKYISKQLQSFHRNTEKKDISLARLRLLSTSTLQTKLKEVFIRNGCTAVLDCDKESTTVYGVLPFDVREAWRLIDLEVSEKLVTAPEENLPLLKKKEWKDKFASFRKKFGSFVDLEVNMKVSAVDLAGPKVLLPELTHLIKSALWIPTGHRTAVSTNMPVVKAMQIIYKRELKEIEAAHQNIFAIFVFEYGQLSLYSKEDKKNAIVSKTKVLIDSIQVKAEIIPTLPQIEYLLKESGKALISSEEKRNGVVIQLKSHETKSINNIVKVGEITIDIKWGALGESRADWILCFVSESGDLLGLGDEPLGDISKDGLRSKISASMSGSKDIGQVKTREFLPAVDRLLGVRAPTSDWDKRLYKAFRMADDGLAESVAFRCMESDKGRLDTDKASMAIIKAAQQLSNNSKSLGLKNIFLMLSNDEVDLGNDYSKELRKYVNQGASGAKPKLLSRFVDRKSKEIPADMSIPNIQTIQIWAASNDTADKTVEVLNSITFEEYPWPVPVKSHQRQIKEVVSNPRIDVTCKVDQNLVILRGKRVDLQQAIRELETLAQKLQK